MRNVIFIALLMGLPLLSVAACAESSALDSRSEIFGISSEDVGGSSYLGVDTRDITSDRLGDLKLKEEKGVEVTMVDQDAPAGKAGLKEHDVILTVNGADVESVEQLRRMIRETPPGRIVTLGLSRNGQPLTVKVQLADRKNSYAYSYSYNGKGKDFHFVMPAIPPIPPIPDIGDIDVPVSIVVVHSSARSGLMVENLTPQLGDFFGSKNGQGVLVRSVEKGSRADKAGFRAGDVIVRINGESIHDSSDFSHALRSRKDNTANVGVIREKKEVNITITLPERKESNLERESQMTPDTDAETREEWSELRSEMAHLQPEIEEAVNQEMQQIRPAMEQRAREMARQRSELRCQVRDMQRSFRDHQREIEREFREQYRDQSDLF
ncbi:MAG: PDZ domain-containing protein [Terriglobales bacterium]